MTLQLRDFKVRNRPVMSGRELSDDLPDQFKANLQDAHVRVGEPFQGLTTDGLLLPGLFSLRKTGLSNAGIKQAADALLASLGTAQRDAVRFDIDSDAWRRWCNIHPYMMRHGVSLEDLDSQPRDFSLALLQASLSDGGYKLSRDIMHLNETIREITGSDDELGEWLYWISVLGQPSADEPWGWQVDGHHLNINYLVVGDQLIATPMFMGSEPVAVDIGKYAGTRVFQSEESIALNLARTFSVEQRRKAIIDEDVPRQIFTGAFRDNFEMRYEGVRFDDLTSQQQTFMFDLIGTYINRMPAGHARLKMDEIKQHLHETYFAWMGGTDEESVFYYRVHSPVVLIEFDHQNGVFLDNDYASRNHIHTVVRTPNGNDYGKDLLRQHREQSSHSHA